MSEHRLDKLLVERPRKGGGIKTPQGEKKWTYKYALEAMGYEPMRRFKTKYFSDHLAPLRRFLFSKVGQPWNAVYSELCRRYDRRTISGWHLFQHLGDFVECHIEFIDGFPYRKSRYLNYPLGSSIDQLYIHPDTGLLCLAKKEPKRHTAKQKHWVKIDPDHQYKKIDEVWYLVSFKEVPFQGKVTDILLNEKLTYWTVRSKYHRTTYAFHKRHCTKKEIKKIKMMQPSN